MNFFWQSRLHATIHNRALEFVNSTFFPSTKVLIVGAKLFSAYVPLVFYPHNAASGGLQWVSFLLVFRMLVLSIQSSGAERNVMHPCHVFLPSSLCSAFLSLSQNIHRLSFKNHSVWWCLMCSVFWPPFLITHHTLSSACLQHQAPGLFIFHVQRMSQRVSALHGVCMWNAFTSIPVWLKV